MYNNKFISAVLVAAGASTRMNKGISKQLLPINGKMVLSYTISSFLNCDIIDEIVVVCPVNETEYFQSVFSVESSIPLKFTEGGLSRQQSVFNGVLQTDVKSDVIAIHDGARPIISSVLIENAVSDCIEYSAVTLAVPVKDTIKEVSESTVESTPDRSRLWAVQTPQVFEKNLYMSAYERSVKSGLDFTDDCQLMEHSGIKVHITQGDYSNIKITTPEDIIIAEALLKQKGDII